MSIGHDIDLETLSRPNDCYPAPSVEALADYWQSCHGSDVQPVDGVLGVVAAPGEQPTALVSVDLCEVLRYTGREYRRAIGLTAINSARYIGDIATNGLDIVTPTVQRLMNDGKVAAIEEIGEVADILRRLRGYGALVIANTSTLPGCEFATIDERFLASQCEGCFDGIVFPRNHDGRGPISKARAASLVMDQQGISRTEDVVTHIDDTPHHLHSFAELYADNPKLGLFMPTLDGNQDDPSVARWRTDSTLAGFQAIEQHLLQYVPRSAA